MYQILIAPNAFKGSLEATDICRILQEELSGDGYRIFSFPLGDGGDGTASLLAHYLKAQPIITQAEDALGRMHETVYYTIADIAIIELAAICGLKLLKPEEYDVLNANTTGLGRVICEAVEYGCKQIMICAGGSASIDGGTGALAAMGMKIVKHSNEYKNHIIEIEDVVIDELKEKFNNISFTVLCDVENPLIGSLGAAKIFAPQKGASDLQVSLLESQLNLYAQILTKMTGKDVAAVKHGGAAGGIAAAFAATLDARLTLGAEYCINLSGFRKQLNTSDLVITGEGKIDSQSLFGKIPGVIAAECRKQQIEVIAVAGMTEDNINIFSHIFVLSDYAGSPAASLLHPERNLRKAAQEIKRRYLTVH